MLLSQCAHYFRNQILHVPTQGKGPGKARFCLHKLKAKQTSMIKPYNKAKQICQVETLLKLVPFHFRDFLKDPQAQHPPNTSCGSQVSAVHIPLPRPQRRPLAKHQASAPSLPMPLPSRSMSVTVLLTFNASARACGQKRWQAGRLTLQSTEPHWASFCGTGECHMPEETQRKAQRTETKTLYLFRVQLQKLMVISLPAWFHRTSYSLANLRTC